MPHFPPFALILTLLLTLLTPTTTLAYRGSLTHYTPGIGSCGHPNTPTDDIVALSAPMMANGANPNANPKCGRAIRIRNGGGQEVHEATVVDTCAGCVGDDVDASVGLFRKVAPGGDGRVEGVEWWFV